MDGDVDHTVLRLERELEKSGVLVGGTGEELGYHGDDILPEAAEDMGSGKCVCVCVCVHAHFFVLTDGHSVISLWEE